MGSAVEFQYFFIPAADQQQGGGIHVGQVLTACQIRPTTARNHRFDVVTQGACCLQRRRRAGDGTKISHRQVARGRRVQFDPSGDREQAVRQQVNVKARLVVQRFREGEQARQQGGDISQLMRAWPLFPLESFNRTLDRVIELAPERIALYNYAHLPSRFKAQRLIVEADLPSAELRLQIFLMSVRRLLDAGYIYIGLDHFSKPDDELNKARLDKSLHRNFQGYTTRADCDLIGFGVSAIGKVGHSYSQSVRTVKAYYEHLDADQLPIEKGFALSPDDVLRRQVIMELMCSGPVNFAAINAAHGIDFCSYFAPELSQLTMYEDAELITVDENSISVTPKGRMFVRAVGMVFDKYLAQQTSAKYSKLI
jgi:oxygen-independent coproporphyrinogen-3 oxidase